MWRSTLSIGCVLIGASWLGTFGLIALGWALDVPYLCHMGLALGLLAGTLTLVYEHHKTRRHMYAVGLSTLGGSSTQVSSLNRVKRD